jgi:hypothetical protein
MLRCTNSTGVAPVGLLLLSSGALLLLLSGCGGEEPSRAESMGLAGEYVDVHRCEDTPSVLQLHDDKSFTYLRGPRMLGEVAPRPETLGEGSWSFESGLLDLRGESWTASFTPDSIWVEIPSGAALMRSLRWVTSTGASPFTASNLVSRAELQELLHPTEGSGSSQF